ncbi:MAG: acyltransferase [Chloroflexi bacterium]|nr:acyltransferase [Chloroflexota bacterium]
MTFHMFSIENFALLELIRPVLLWIILVDNSIEKKLWLNQVIRIWLPYIVVFLVFFVWRVFIFKFPTYEPGFLNSLVEAPFGAISALAARIPRDFFTATAGAWIDSITFPTISSFGTAATFLFWGLLLGTFLIAGLFILLSATQGESKPRLYSSILFTGFILFVLGAALIWVLDLPLRIEFAWDRMTIGLIPGVAILIGLAGSLIFQKNKWLGCFVFSGLIALAVGSHFFNGMNYKRDWENLQDLFQQLVWRIPSLEDETSLLSSEPGVFYYSDNSLTSPLNLTYSDNVNNKTLDHFFFFTDVRMGLALSELNKEIPISQGYRSFLFTGNTSKMVAIRFNPPACMNVMDRNFSNSITNLNLTDIQTQELRLTDLQMILPLPQHQPAGFIVKEFNAESWCYYFQKADLARQLGHYDQVAALGDHAVENGLHPREASEWLPFLEGYAWLGRWDRVDLVLEEISLLNPDYQNGVCYTMRRIHNTDGFPQPEKLSELLNVYNCP